MNIVLSAIILIILLLPGVVAIRAYYTSFTDKESGIAIPFNDLLIKGILISIFLHAIAIGIIYLLNFTISFNLVYDILSGKDIYASDSYLSSYFFEFIWYNILISLLAWFMAKGFKSWVRRRNFDINFFSLKNTNYWYYVFSGRYLDTKGVQGTEAETDLIVLDILTNSNIIYSGILLDFNYSPLKDELQNIVLGSAYKRSFEKEDKNENSGQSTGIPTLIPGDVFIIPMSKIVNININYISIS
ncbi:MAG TPA: hypothetical protein VLS85_01650 [Hanamia sp.]|nr:hypothetical protein [Hanamia sp.]